jgi:hypothetical protein
LTQFADENQVDLEQVKDIVMMRLMNLQSNILTQFPKLPENVLGWIQDPFSFSTNKMSSELMLKE